MFRCWLTGIPRWSSHNHVLSAEVVGGRTSVMGLPSGQDVILPERISVRVLLETARGEGVFAVAMTMSAAEARGRDASRLKPSVRAADDRLYRR